jgi:hypothetical protein
MRKAELGLVVLLGDLKDNVSAIPFTGVGSIAVNFSRPSPTNVVDGVKDFFGRLVYRKRRGVIFSLHRLLSVRFRR